MFWTNSRATSRSVGPDAAVADGLHGGLGAETEQTSKTRKPALEAGSLRLRGKDSNLDYLIQSQASYH